MADVSTADDLKTALEAGGEITIGGDINVTGSLTVSKNTTIDMAGHTLTFSGLGEAGSAFQVNKGINLTIKNAGVLTTSDGNGRAIAANQGGSTVTLTGNGWTTSNTDASNALLITNFHSNGNGGAVLIENGTLNAQYTMFGKWSTTYGVLSADNGGAVYAENTTVSINNCRFFLNDSTHSYSKPEYNGGGAIYLSGHNSSGTISNSYFWYCRSNNCGMGVHLAAVGGDVTLTNNWFYMCETIGWNNPAIKGSVKDGGGAYVRICKNVTFDSNTFQQNHVSGNGGGVAVMGGFTIEGDATACSTVTFRNNTIKKNESRNRGGGIYFKMTPKDKVNLESGIITGNTAAYFGGGISYTTHNATKLILKNVLISGNEAARGAGIWCCPTSITDMYSTVGGAIFGNKSSGEATSSTYATLHASGDDIRYEYFEDSPDEFAMSTFKKDENTVYYMSVINRAFNGAPITWYRDEADDRYEEGDEPVDLSGYQKITLSFGLHGEMDEDLAALISKEATLIITNNKVTNGRGGGIASNTAVQIGEANKDITVTVIKQWAQDEHPEEIKVDLYRVDADGTRVKLDRDVVLNKENQWCATFESLPAYTIDKAGKQSDYTYDVVEQSVNGWDCSSAREETDDGCEITITLTNSKHIEVSPDEPEINVPSTGDSTPIMLWSLLALLSAAGIAVIVKRRAAQR